MMSAYFGSPDQQAMARRAFHIWRLMYDDPRLYYQGRFLGMTTPAPGLDRFEDLVRLQGASVLCRVPRADLPVVTADLEARGLRTDPLGLALSRGDAVGMARDLLARHALPTDIKATRLGAVSPTRDIADFAEVALENGVLPPPEHVLRGETRRGVFLLARERKGGRAVATGAALESHHPKGDLAETCSWGLLATRPDRRGEKIALVLGAEAMVTMHREFGFSSFMTGIRDDNAQSLALSAKLGVVASDKMFVISMDPSAFADARVTK